MPCSQDSPADGTDSQESGTRTHITRHDWGDGDRPSHCVVHHVSETLGVDPSQTRPLFEVVDPDALDAAFTRQGSRQSTVDRIAFHYEGYEVTVRADGRVVASERCGEKSPRARFQ